jgi:hypothetical protein
MRKAHREAAKALYEERNKHLQNGDSTDEELYVDLHGTSHLALLLQKSNLLPLTVNTTINRPSTQASTPKKQSPTSKPFFSPTRLPPPSTPTRIVTSFTPSQEQVTTARTARTKSARAYAAG